MTDNCFTEFCCFLSNFNMSQPQVYIYPLPHLYFLITAIYGVILLIPHSLILCVQSIGKLVDFSFELCLKIYTCLSSSPLPTYSNYCHIPDVFLQLFSCCSKFHPYISVVFLYWIVIRILVSHINSWTLQVLENC